MSHPILDNPIFASHPSSELVHAGVPRQSSSSGETTAIPQVTSAISGLQDVC